MQSVGTQQGRYYLYIVQCADGSYYTGSTSDLERRLKLHNSGNGSKYVRGKLPVRLVYAKAYRSYLNVLRAERNMKKLTRRQKEETIAAHGKRY